MKIELNLTYPGKYQWTYHEQIYFIGYAFDNEGQLYQHAKDFEQKDIKSCIHQLKGAFAFVVKQEKQLSVYTDTIASFPLFYKEQDRSIIIQSTPTHSDNGLSAAALEDFLNIYCTQSHDTLYDDWKSIPAGHVLQVDIPLHSVKSQRYFEHYCSEKYNSTTETTEKLLNIIHQWAQQIIQFAAGKPIWVPLSGGYDSRLILSTLAKEKAPNLHAYTYGKSLSQEVINAHKTAKELNIDWHFIPYNEQAFTYFFTEHWTNYALHNHHFQSLPHEQDFFALLALKNQGVLGEDFIVVPGFCGDIPTGSFLKTFDIAPKSYIKDMHQVSAKGLVESISPWDAYQQWLCENRLSKFIVNSTRVFEYFGGKWMLPMWHRDFLELFYSLNFEEKWDQKFYIATIFEHYFRPANIDFIKHSGDTATASPSLKDELKKILPAALVKNIRKITGKTSAADPCNIHTLYEMLYFYMRQQGIPLPEKDGNFNRLHAHYMLEIIKKGR